VEPLNVDKMKRLKLLILIVQKLIKGEITEVKEMYAPAVHEEFSSEPIFLDPDNAMGKLYSTYPHKLYNSHAEASKIVTAELKDYNINDVDVASAKTWVLW